MGWPKRVRRVVVDTLIVVAVLYLWLCFAVIGFITPPRSLNNGVLASFLLVPAVTFILGVPRVRLRWFGYVAAVMTAVMIDGHAHHIYGTNKGLGWHDSILRFVIPSLIFGANVTLSVLSAKLRQSLQTAGLGE